MCRSTTWSLLFLLGLVVTAGCEKESVVQAPLPPKVSVQQPEVKTIAIFHEENGETEAVQQAVVRARVRGVLQEINFEPGDKIGQDNINKPLFRIEKNEYEARVQSATAAVSSAKATVVSAEAAIGVYEADISAANASIAEADAEMGRLNQLKATNSITQSEYDAAVAKLETAKAALKKAEAAREAAKADLVNATALVEKAEADLRQAELELDWTDIKAPIEGRLTEPLVKVGNLVEPGMEMVEIIRASPIWANFNLSERFLLDMEKVSDGKPSRERDLSSIKVYLQRSGDVGFPFVGRLDFADPKVDQETGTMKLRAVFDNDDSSRLLIPGLFVRVRIQIGEEIDALLIPERAVGRDKTGTYVYVIGSDNKAQRRNLILGTKQEDGTVVVRDGLTATDQVIVDGIQRVRSGATVDPT